VKRDFAALEKRRFEAVRLLEKGELNQFEVARRVHVCRQTVSRWAEELRPGGCEALKKAGRGGRKPELTAGDRKRLEETSEMPSETGLRASPVDLRAGGGSDSLELPAPDRTIGQAREPNEEAIRRWRRVECPQ
jgi:predicted DNA-binding protein (UPF0251 family)